MRRELSRSCSATAGPRAFRAFLGSTSARTTTGWRTGKTAHFSHRSWEVQQLLYFCQKLDAIDEGGTTMLDNSLVFASSEIANGNRHDQANKPILVLGSAAGKVKVGQHLKFTNNEAQADLMVALLNALGVPATTFGLKQGPGQATCTTCGPAGTMPLPGVL